jgi:Tol biopolymer transport system component
MTPQDRFDGTITSLLSDMAPPAIPEYVDLIRANARSTRQRPVWTFPARWLPFQIPAAPFGRLPLMAWLLLVLGLLGLLVIAGLAGSQRRVPAPLGAARNGVIAFDRDGRILVTDPTEGTLRALTSGTGSDSRVSFSPDGVRLAFWRQAGASTALVVADADGANQRQLFSLDPAEGREAVLEPPAWAPGSDRIAVSVLDESGPDPLALVWIVDVASGAHSTLLPPSLFAAANPVWSPDGARIAFLGEPTHRAEGFLYVSNVDGSGLIRISARASSAATGYLSGPAWSSDGAWIVVAYGDSGRLSRDILQVATDHVDDHVLVGTPKDEAFPAWSPDDRQLAYWRSTDGYRWQVVIRDLTSGAELASTWQSPTADPLVWSPDGRSLTASSCASSSCRIYLIDAAIPTNEPTLVAELPPKSYDVSISQAYWSWQRLAP